MSNSMSMRRCETCGGELIFNEGSRFWQCRFCGNKFYPKDEKGEALVFALNRAAEFRRRSDFDGAIVEYTTILKTYPDDDEANWGMFIARCGIEYVKDDRTGNMIPTCHRTLKGNVLEDAFYLKAVENASEQQSEIYQKQAKAIERLQKRIKQQMDDEEEYEVFISFKSKDENGYPTKDSVVARNIHDKLTSMGIKTFFSEVTLADRIGDEYEPIIYKALHSCKYFILVTTSEVHTNAVWVKNEWARFRDRMHDENLSKCAFAVFEGKDCVPSFLRGMQGFDLSKYPSGGYEIAVADFLALKLGKVKKDDEAEKLKAQLEEQRKFYAEQQKKQEEDLLRRIEELDSRSSHQPANAFAGSAKDSIAPLLKRAFMFLEDGEWQSADEYCEKVLDIDPENAKAYVGKLMAEKHIKRQDDLASCPEPFDNDPIFKKAIKYGDSDLKNALQGYIDLINKRNEEARKEKTYQDAKKLKESKDESSHLKAAELFNSLGDYKDSKEYYNEIEHLKLEALERKYLLAVSNMKEANSEKAFLDVAKKFKELGDYKDAKACQEKCIEQADDAKNNAKYSLAMESYETIARNIKSSNNIQHAQIEKLVNVKNRFESLGEYKDSQKMVRLCDDRIADITAAIENERIAQEQRLKQYKIENERRRKRNIKISAIAASIVVVLLIALLVIINVVIPTIKYNNAVELMNSGKYEEAILILSDLNDFKDSKDKLAQCWAIRLNIPASEIVVATSEDMPYLTIENGNIKLSGNYTEKDLIVPHVYNSEIVTGIGSSAFYGCTSITSITIPNTVSSIGDKAFFNCSSLTSITIPDGVTNIGKDTFYHCIRLKNITIPDSVTSIGDAAFSNCSSLTSITIPDGVTSIGNRAFFSCSSLTSVTIPDGVTNIGKDTFFHCIGLKSITIPDSVTSIGDYAFSSCSSLTSITIPDSVTSIGNNAFSSCSSLTSITIPDSVTSIGDNAFSSCSSLTSITIPDSVMNIGDFAFYSCSSLTSITIPDGVTSIGNRAFFSCSNLTSITFEGTTAQWDAIDKANFWYPDGEYTIHCTDGDISK